MDTLFPGNTDMNSSWLFTVTQLATVLYWFNVVSDSFTQAQNRPTATVFPIQMCIYYISLSTCLEIDMQSAYAFYQLKLE